MTEQEAIQSLADELIREDEVSTQEIQETPDQIEQQENQNVITQQNLQDAINNALAQKQVSQTQEQDSQSNNVNSELGVNEFSEEQLKTLNSLGLGGINELIRAVKDIQKQNEEVKAEKQRRESFAVEIEKFKETYPTIKPDEIAKWANERGFDALLSQGFDGWSAIAKEMIKQAKNTQIPDEIIGTNKLGNELGAFEKIKKGEEVSDIEIGTDLLKSAGLL